MFIEKIVPEERTLQDLEVVMDRGQIPALAEMKKLVAVDAIEKTRDNTADAEGKAIEAEEVNHLAQRAFIMEPEKSELVRARVPGARRVPQIAYNGAETTKQVAEKNAEELETRTMKTVPVMAPATVVVKGLSEEKNQGFVLKQSFFCYTCFFK